MLVSSRTPEGEPVRCVICGNEGAVEPSYPGGDACCPTCGSLVWRVRDVVARSLRLEPEQLTLVSNDVSEADSLDAVELVMALEEEFDVEFLDDAAMKIKTLNDAIRYILRAKRSLA